MKTSVAEKIFRILFVFVFVFGTAWVPGTNANAEEPNRDLPGVPNRATMSPSLDFLGFGRHLANELGLALENGLATLERQFSDLSNYAQISGPRIVASITGNWFQGEDFTPGGDINLKIYDTQGGGLLWEENRTADGSGLVFVGEWEHPVDLVPGTYITIADGTTTKSLELEAVTLDTFDTDADYLAGTAPAAPGGRSVWVGTGNDSSGCSMDVTADPVSGAWEADFSTQPCDVLDDMWGAAQVFDADGDATEANPPPPPPNPHFVVFPEWEFFDGHDWPDGATVTITVAGKSACETTQISSEGYFSAGFEENCNVVIGDTITFTDGTTTRTHTVRNLAITGVDPDTDIVAGMADEGAIVNVWPHATGEQVQVTADAGGTWQVDFTGSFDLVPGEGGRSEIRDEVGNATAVDWYVPRPYFQVQIGTNNVDGWEWTPNAQVTITINGMEATTVPTDEWGTFRSHFEELEPFVSGMDFLITDGVSTKTMTTAYLEITDVDPDLDTVSGKANAGQTFNVWVHGENAPNVQVTADALGQWNADFSGQWDVVPGSDGAAQIDDEDGDGTWVPWRLPNPTFGVWLPEEHVNGWEWTPGATIEVTVGDYSDTTTTDEWGNFHLELGGTLGIQAGTLVQVSDGVRTKSHIISSLVVTDADPMTDTVSGKAEAGSIANVWVCWDNGCANRHETADANGDWTANFAVPGDEDDEQDTFDLQPGTGSDANQSDEDGDFTQIHWRISNPYFEVRHNEDRISGWEWQPNASVDISVDGIYIATAPTNEWGDFGIGVGETVDLVPGNNIEVTDAVSTKAHIVTPLSIVSVDVDTDIIAGTGTRDGRIKVWACGPDGCVDRWETVDGSGNWSANFSIPGDEEGEEQSFNIVPGTSGDSGEWDEDGDYTIAGFHVPNPYFEVRSDGDQINGWEWQPNASVEISVDGIFIATAPTNEWGDFGIGVGEWVDLIPGSVVEVSDGASSKAHTVTPLSITSVDADTDIVSGTATPDGRIQVWTCWPDGCANRWETVDGAGNWSANFSIEGDEPGEEQTFNIVPGTGLDSGEWDEDGDYTIARYYIPNPRFVVFPEWEFFDGHDWPDGATVTITVEGKLECSLAKESWGGFFNGNFPEGCDVAIGDTVTFDDGTTTRTHVVRNLDVADVDVDANTIAGIADAGTLVYVWPHDAWFGPLEAVADSQGVWQVDLDDEGYDIQKGAGGRSEIRDEGGNATAVDWYVPNPRFQVGYDGDWINGWDWQPNVGVDIRVNGGLIATVQTDAGGNFDIGVGEWVDLLPGSVVEVTDGVTIKAHTVTNLNITGVDVDTEIVSGIATPNGRIQVWTCLPDNCINRWETVDNNGNWTANFAVQGDEPGEEQTFDIVPGTNLDSGEWDEDGDNTLDGWYVPNPRFVVFPEGEFFDGHDWLDGATVTITVEGKPECELTKVSWDYFFNGNFPEGCDVAIDDIVTFSDGTTTRTHVVRNLDVTDVDVDANTIAGTADAGTLVYVWPHDGWFGPLEAIADSQGVWQVDLDDAGYDIQKGAAGRSEIRDEVGNATAVDWYVPNPRFDAWYRDGHIETYDWPAGALLTLDIEDPTTPGSPDYSSTTQDGSFYLNGAFEIQPGMTLTVSGASFTKELVVSNLTIVNIDLVNDIITGGSEPNQMMSMSYDSPSGTCCRSFQADGSGVWTVDYSQPGPNGEPVEDIRPGSSGTVNARDEDGDNTSLSWNILNPRIEVLAFADRIALVDWPAGQNVHLFVDDPATVLFPDFEQDFLPEQDWSYYEFFVTYDMKPGDLVSASNGTTTKTLEIALLQATDIDPNTGFVRGVAVPNTQIDMQIAGDHFDVTPVSFVVDVDGNGEWTGDFGDIPGSLLPWTWSVVGSMRQWDEDQDMTLAHWHNHWPVLEIWLNEAELRAFDWPVGATLTFTVDDPTTYQPVDFSQQAETTPLVWMDHGGATVSVRGSLELQPGMMVTVTDGTNTKSTVVRGIGFDQIDAANNTVHGYAPANADLDLIIDKGYWSQRYFSADANGDWIVDYSTPDAAGRTLDLEPGDQFYGLFMRDEEFDSTVRSGHVPNPSFAARVTENEVHGYDWLLGTQVTLTIDDPDNGTGLDYTDTKTAIVADWGPNQTFVQFQLGSFVLEPGQLVTMTDGIVTKTHTVTNLTVTAVDHVADTVSGTAAPGSLVEVGHIYCDETGCYGFRRVNADANGNWVADFAHPGEDQDEQDTIDIVPGMGNEARQPDEDWDTTNVQWRVPNPHLDAWYRDGHINAYEWPLGTQLTLEIDDPATPDVSPDYSTTTVVGISPWNPNETLGEFYLNGAFEILPGMTLTVSGASFTKELVVSNLTITDINQDADVITGGAEPDQSMWMWFDSPSGNCCRDFQADGAGVWTVDYSQPGPNGEPVEDIRPGSSGTINARDEDGDNTSLSWRVPNPFVEASPNSNWVHAREWPLGTEVTLTIDGAGGHYTTTAIMQQAPWNPDDPNDIVADFDLQGYDIQAGDSVTATVGTESKTLIVSQLQVTSFDLANDTLSGKATPGVEVQVCANVPGNCISRWITPDGAGDWTADYSGEFDLQPGSNGWAAEREADGDQTWYDWRVPNPTLGVRANTNAVEGWEWPLGASVTVTVDDPGTAPSPDITRTAVVYEAPWNPGEYRFDVDLNGEFDIQPGHIVTASHGATTKTHTVTGHMFTEINIATDMVTGTAEAGSRLDVWACDNVTCINRHVDTNGSGVWSADFAHPGVEPDEQNTFDITYGTWVDSSQSDEDGDVTMFGQKVPNPTLGVRANTDAVEGWEWTLGETITVTVDDPGTAPSPDVSRTAVVYEAPWNPGEFRFDVDLNGEFDIQPGDVVTASNGVRTKTHTVTAHAFTNIDIGTDTVTGTAQAGSRVDVWACDNVTCINRHVDTDGSGVWSADFSHPGDEGDEQDTFDITFGTWVDSSQSDEDGDVTMFGQNALNYTLHVVPTYPEVHGHEWPLNASVTLTIDNDTEPGNGVLYTRTKNVSDDPWCGEPCFDLQGLFTLQVGQYVTMTDGNVTKTVQISVLQITEVNRETDIISGIADPGSRVAVNIWSQNGLARYVTTDATGHWVADFSVVGDEDFEQTTADLDYGDNGRAIQLSLDGTDDGTLEYWSIESLPVIFADGFESGDFSQWSSCTTDVNDLSVSAAAKLAGNYGMQALLDDNAPIYCTSDHPEAETRYLASFHFDPNSITMVSSDAHRIFYGYSGATKVVLRVEFRRSANLYQLRAGILTDASTWRNSAWFTITDEPHTVALDWRAATAAGANDGGLTLWIDGTQKADLTVVDNDTWRIDRAQLGAVNGIDTGTRGTYYFDEFESSRGDAGPTPTFALTVNITGTGGGTVTSSPAGIDCGADCAESYPSGTAVALTATPDPGSTFTGWSGGGCSGTGTCIVTITADTVVTANFDAAPVSDNLLGNASFEIDANNDGRPDVWSTNAKFTRSNAIAPMDGSYVGRFYATDNTGATIQQVVQNLTAGSTYNFSGLVNIPTTSDTFTFKIQVKWRNASNAAIGTSVIKTYTTATNGWNEATASLVAPAGATNALVQMIANNLNATIYVDKFFFGGSAGPGTNTLTVNKTGTGSGRVTSSPAGIDCGSTCSAVFNTDTVVTLTATPDAGSTFTGWSGAGCSGTGTCIVTLTADTSVTANFDSQSSSHTLSVNKTGTGSGTVTSSPAGIDCGLTCSAAFNSNTVVTLTATAAPGSTFTGWSGGGCSGTGTCMVTLTAATSVTANFDLTAPADTIFADGFETGNLTNWTACTTDVNDLSVSAGAKLVGNFGMQALLDDNAGIYCTDDTPNAEPRYRARFYFDPNSIPMASGDAHFIFNGFMGASTAVLRVEFRYFSGAYQIRARLVNDGSTWTNTSWFTISDAAYAIEVDWQASTAVGANNGSLTLWIDGVQQANLTGVDNDTRRIDRARLGTVAGVDTGTRGTYYFDAFVSQRQNYIGP